MKLTMHSGRCGSARHNDRSFTPSRETASNIDFTATNKNRVWSWNGENDFTKSELAFYEQRYGEAVRQTNENYVRTRHPERCRDINSVYTGRLTKPEEVILQVGSMVDDINPDTFNRCVEEYLAEFERWNREHGSHGHILTVAIHHDEDTPHAHIRRVWDYTDENGVVHLGQNQGLKQAGIRLPNPKEKESRFNNRKMTLDVHLREMAQNVFERVGGYKLDREVYEVNAKHLSVARYKAQKLSEEVYDLENEKKALKAEIEAYKHTDSFQQIVERAKSETELERYRQLEKQFPDELATLRKRQQNHNREAHLTR